MSDNQQDSTCPIDCRTANTPTEECECSCGGERHGSQSTMTDFGTANKDEFDWDEDGVVECANCEKLMVVTDRDCCATSLGTPVSRYCGFDDVDFDDRYDWIPICSDCYDYASEQIDQGDLR